MAWRVKGREKGYKLPGATRTVFVTSRYFLEKKNQIVSNVFREEHVYEAINVDRERLIIWRVT